MTSDLPPVKPKSCTTCRFWGAPTGQRDKFASAFHTRSCTRVPPVPTAVVREKYPASGDYLHEVRNKLPQTRGDFHCGEWRHYQSLWQRIISWFKADDP